MANQAALNKLKLAASAVLPPSPTLEFHALSGPVIPTAPDERVQVKVPERVISPELKLAANIVDTMLFYYAGKFSSHVLEAFKSKPVDLDHPFNRLLLECGETWNKASIRPITEFFSQCLEIEKSLMNGNIATREARDLRYGNNGELIKCIETTAAALAATITTSAKASPSDRFKLLLAFAALQRDSLVSIADVVMNSDEDYSLFYARRIVDLHLNLFSAVVEHVIHLMPSEESAPFKKWIGDRTIPFPKQLVAPSGGTKELVRRLNSMWAYDRKIRLVVSGMETNSIIDAQVDPNFSTECAQYRTVLDFTYLPPYTFVVRNSLGNDIHVFRRFNEATGPTVGIAGSFGRSSDAFTRNDDVTSTVSPFAKTLEWSCWPNRGLSAELESTSWPIQPKTLAPLKWAERVEPVIAKTLAFARKLFFSKTLPDNSLVIIDPVQDQGLPDVLIGVKSGFLLPKNKNFSAVKQNKFEKEALVTSMAIVNGEQFDFYQLAPSTHYYTQELDVNRYQLICHELLLRQTFDEHAHFLAEVFRGKISYAPGSAEPISVSRTFQVLVPETEILVAERTVVLHRADWHTDPDSRRSAKILESNLERLGLPLEKLAKYSEDLLRSVAEKYATNEEILKNW